MIKRTKVALFNQESIPKAELQAAVIVARFFKFTTEESRLNFSSLLFWTDSTTVLAWINSPENQKTYCANSVNEILPVSEAQQWNHIPAKRNPADRATRGIPIQDVEQLWLQAPEFLLLPESVWPQSKLQEDAVTQPVFTSKDKKRTTTIKVDSPILHTNAMLKR